MIVMTIRVVVWPFVCIRIFPIFYSTLPRRLNFWLSRFPPLGVLFALLTFIILLGQSPVSMFDKWVLSSSKVVLCGDFNAHHEWWGSSSTRVVGDQVDALVESTDLDLLNDGTGTRLNNSGSRSAIDLSFVSPSLLVAFVWEVFPSTFGSDHFLSCLASTFLWNTMTWPHLGGLLRRPTGRASLLDAPSILRMICWIPWILMVPVCILLTPLSGTQRPLYLSLNLGGNIMMFLTGMIHVRMLSKNRHEPIVALSALDFWATKSCIMRPVHVPGVLYWMPRGLIGIAFVKGWMPTLL